MSHDPANENALEAEQINMSTPARVILLCCGSFNPITNMHLRMFELARDALHRTGKYRVVGGIISPVNDAYGKKDLVPAKQRLAMAKLAAKSTDWIRVDSWESEQDSWSETIKVLKHHKQILDSMYNANTQPDTPTKKRKIDRDAQGSDDVDYAIPSHHQHHNLLNEAGGPVQLKLLCGADLLESFGTPGLWKDGDIEEIVGRFGLVCISRGGSSPEKFIYESDMLYRYQNNIHHVTEWISNEISSTKIRRALLRGESVKYLLQDSVISYINEHQLYGAGDNKYMNYITPSPNKEEPEINHINIINTTPDVNYLSPLSPLTPRQYRRLENDEYSRSDHSSTESLDHSPRMNRRAVTCVGADVSGLVRRVKNMRVAMTPETCV